MAKAWVHVALADEDFAREAAYEPTAGFIPETFHSGGGQLPITLTVARIFCAEGSAGAAGGQSVTRSR